MSTSYGERAHVGFSQHWTAMVNYSLGTTLMVSFFTLVKVKEKKTLQVETVLKGTQFTYLMSLTTPTLVTSMNCKMSLTSYWLANFLSMSKRLRLNKLAMPFNKKLKDKTKTFHRRINMICKTTSLDSIKLAPKVLSKTIK